MSAQPIAEVPATAIAEYNPIAAALADLTKRHKGVVFDVGQPSGLKAAKEAAKDIGQYRIALEKKRKDLKEDVLVRGRLIDGEAKRIADQLAALEDPIVDQIKAEERRVEAEREAAIKAEQERLAREEAERKEAEERKLAEARAKLAAEREAFEREQAAARQRAEAEERARREAEDKARALRQAEEDRLAGERRKVEEERAALEREKLAKELAEKRAAEEAAAKKRAKEEAARRAKEEVERKQREAKEAAERERRRAEQELVDARAILAKHGLVGVLSDLWTEILEFIEGQVDVRDGSDGPQPNKAMSLSQQINQAGLGG